MTLNRQLGTVLSNAIGTDVAAQNSGNKYRIHVIHFTPWLTDANWKKGTKDLKKLFKTTGVKIVKAIDEDGVIYIQMPCTIDDYETLLRLRGIIN